MSRSRGMSDSARHLGGCLLARAPDLIVEVTAWFLLLSCLYEACRFLIVTLGSFCPFRLPPFDELGIPWEIMVDNLKNFQAQDLAGKLWPQTHSPVIPT